MTTVTVTPLFACGGHALASSTTHSASSKTQVSDEEALSANFIPAEAISAVQISAHRILATGGIIDGSRALPFSVIRYLDLETALDDPPLWTKPLSLRPSSRRRAAPAFPISRDSHTFTKDPSTGRIYLIGGLKVGVKDLNAAPCKSLFAYDVSREKWEAIHSPQADSDFKQDRIDFIGPRFSHVAVFVPSTVEKTRTRQRTKAARILVHGGYASVDDNSPVRDVHALDLKTQRWQLCKKARGGVAAPARANHAASLSPSGRYLTIHGGNTSAYEDDLAVTDTLYVYDTQQMIWSVPKLHSSSQPPPTARRRHSLVQGVGVHAGHLLLYGGQLKLGEYSDHIFTLRLLDAARPGDSVLAIWEKLSLVSSVPRRVAGTLDLDQPKSSLEMASAGGVLIPVEEQERYLLIGGRGEYGLRNCPLLLDARQSDSMDVEEDNSEFDHGQKKIMLTLSLKPSDPVSPSSAEKSITKSEDEDAVGQLTKNDNSSKRGNALDANFRANTALPSPENSLMGPQISSFQPTPTTDRSSTPVAACPAQDAQGHIKMELCVKKALSSQPTPKVVSAKAAKVKTRGVKRPRPKQVSPSEQDDPIDSVDGIDEGSWPPSTLEDKRQGAIKSDDIETPTRKKSKRPAVNKVMSPEGDIMDDADPDEKSPAPFLPESAGSSDFMPASAYARKGKSRIAKTGRGRGRPRSQASGRTTAQTVAEAREAQKEKEAEDAAILENARLVKQLKSENAQLQREKEKVNSDNQKLNKEMSSLLTEIRTLRNQSRRCASREKEISASYSPSVRNLSESASDPQQGNTKAVAAPSAEIVEELNALKSRTTDLEEECQEITAERDGVMQSLKETEKALRSLEFEYNKSKNIIGELETDRNAMRKQVLDFKTVALDASEASEVAHRHRTRIEEENGVLKRELEAIQSEMRALHDRRAEDELQLGAAIRETTSARKELADFKKQNEQHGSKESVLQGSLASQQSKVDELRGMLDDAIKTKEATDEKNLDLMAEVERLKMELSTKLKDCEASIQEAHKSRKQLDKERKEGADCKLEHNRLSRELERVIKQYEALRKYAQNREAMLQQLIPALKRVTRDFGVLADSHDEHRIMSRGLCVANGGEMGSESVDKESAGGKHVDIEEGGKGGSTATQVASVKKYETERNSKVSKDVERKGSSLAIEKPKSGNANVGKRALKEATEAVDEHTVGSNEKKVSTSDDEAIDIDNVDEP